MLHLLTSKFYVLEPWYNLLGRALIIRVTISEEKANIV
jgi:hypothetical protein